MPITPFAPRPLSYLGLREAHGFRLKVYAIAYGDRPLRADHFDRGFAAATAQLPQPAVAGGRPGVGFAVCHQGRTGDYVVLCWWDNENELPTRVLLADGDGWRPATGGESFCVWDLRVVWWEREAYVGTVLAGRPDGVAAYLAAVGTGVA
jgi:hypothetical protein